MQVPAIEPMEAKEISSNSNNNEDLVQLLKEQTEWKEPAPFDVNDEIFPNDGPHIDNADFDENLISENLPNPIEKENIKIPVNYTQLAETYITAGDGLQILVLPFLYERSIFDKKDKELLLKWKRSGKPEIKDMTEEEKSLNLRWIEYKKLSDEVALSNDEKEAIKGPLAQWLTEKQATPANALTMLVIVLIGVMAPRLMPLFYSIEKKL